ncbi:MAG: hypothetical protein KatS3mg023_2386 [Armatimonadota bacterium]|nr:MAG: hypothetical protein KatS3mg023_2386 [Armatimonadota bacterium]
MMKNSGQIKPWHIVLFVLAIVLVLWQALGYYREKQQRLHGEYRMPPPGASLTPQMQPRAGTPGQPAQPGVR